MTQLKNDVAALRRLFEPWLAASGDTLIFPPEESDENAPFKRELFAKAQQILAAGDSAISGAAFDLPELGNLEFRAIDQALGADPLKSEWVELSTACERVVQSIARAAA
jgi:hypothetical protein